MWKTFTDCFNCLPIAAIIDEKIFCCHGGLSPDLQSMEQIRRIMRPTDVPDQGLLCDLLWSDPDKETMGWGENDRGVSFTFGAEVVAKFLHKHDLDLICRAHQVRHIFSFYIRYKTVKKNIHFINDMLWASGLSILLSMFCSDFWKLAKNGNHEFLPWVMLYTM